MKSESDLGMQSNVAAIPGSFMSSQNIDQDSLLIPRAEYKPMVTQCKECQTRSRGTSPDILLHTLEYFSNAGITYCEIMGTIAMNSK